MGCAMRVIGSDSVISRDGAALGCRSGRIGATVQVNPVDCKTVDLFVQTVSGAPGLSDWARWLVNSPDQSAQQTIELLSGAFAHVAPNAQRKVLQRLRNADASNVDALLHELLIFDVCRRFGLFPEFEPNSGGQNARSKAVHC